MFSYIHKLRESLPPTETRVHQQTSSKVNAEITRKTIANLQHWKDRGPGELDKRLKVLQSEWNVDRVMELLCGALCILGLLLGNWGSRNYLVLSLLGSLFIVLYSLLGWNSFLSVLRRMNVRTSSEIFQEMEALRIIRGDFTVISPRDAVIHAETQLNHLHY